MSQVTEIANMIKSQNRLDHTKETLAIPQWVMWLKDNKDARLSNLGSSLAWGCKTGRITNWNHEKQLTNHKTLKPLSNKQVADLLAKAAVMLPETGGTLTEGLDALQAAMGKKVVVM